MQIDDAVVRSEWSEPGVNAVASPLTDTTSELNSGATADDSAAAETAGDSETLDETEEHEGSESDAGTAKKGKGGFQRKIDRLTREKRELEERLASLAGQPAEAQSHSDKPAEAPKGKPRESDFQTYESYTEALVEWSTDQREYKRAAEAQARLERDSAQAKVSAFNGQVNQVRDKYADFDSVVNDDVRVSAAMRDTILDSDLGAELLYALAKDPSEAGRIAKLSPLAAAREIGKIEARIAGSTTPATPAIKISGAKPPVKPLTGGSGPVVVDWETTDYDTYKAHRNAGRKP